MALASMMAKASDNDVNGVLGGPKTKPKAKRVIYLFQSGGPSQFELFGNKPYLRENHGVELPTSERGRETGMSSHQASIPMAGSVCTEFNRHGKSGQEMSDFIPWHHKIADDICIMRNVYTDAINHDPAITFIQTGAQIAGRPSIGSWLSYGLGTDNADLPNFIVMVSKNGGGQPLYSRLWGSGFLDSRHQGMQFLSGKDRVLYLSNPEGVSRQGRRSMLNKLNELNREAYEKELDPEIESRIAQYEMAYRMQARAPELMDFSKESKKTLELYGVKEGKSDFASNCLLARRLVERGSRFVQLYHSGWDAHSNVKGNITKNAKTIDQASAALVQDLKQRGMLEDTLVVWGGEFGRTPMVEASAALKRSGGRDHHPQAFTMWMAGGGVKPGITVGKTDELGFHVTEDPVHVHDLQATILQLMGIDHTRLSFRSQGLDFRLTGVEPHHAVKKLIA